MAFLDVTGGTGGAITIPAVPKGYLVRNAATGDVSITAGGALTYVLHTGDILPVQTDGASVYGLQIAGLPLTTYLTTSFATINAGWAAGDATLLAYINAAITAGVASLPPPAGQFGKALMVRGTALAPVWAADFIYPGDLQGWAGTARRRDLFMLKRVC